MPVDPARVRRLLADALDVPEPERAEFLDEACGEDAALRREVESLLAADRAAGSFMGAPAGGDDSLIGRTIGAYTIVDVVARGGMGIVYRARQENPDRQVALKLMARGLLAPEMQRRFDVEVQVLGRLQHPGIAQIFEAGTADTGHGPRPFFAMEYIDGLPLTEWADEKRLGPRDRLALMIRVCEGVQHAHQKGVIHRDLKPANILVDSSGQPKVLDFGVARGTDVDLQVTTIESNRGALLGTLPYMSPEQVRGNTAELDTRSDVYALGVVCYELLTGRLPHDLEGKSITEAIRAISEESPRTLSAAGLSIEIDVETIVAKALSPEPSQRYDSVSALAADLGRFLDNQPISARPPSTLYLLRKLVARNRLASGLAAALILLLIGFSAAMMAQTRRIAAERDRASSEAATSRQVTEFLQDLFSDPDPARSRGNQVTAREILDRGSGRIESDLEEQPLVQARLMVIMGGVYQNLGLDEPARQLLESGIEIARTVQGTAPQILVEGLRSLAWLHRDAGSYEEGVALASEALESAERLLDPQDALNGGVLLTLGVLLRDSADLDEARKVLDRTREFAETTAGTRSVLYARSLYHMAWVEHQSGNARAAAELYEQACPIFEQALGSDHPELGHCHHDHSNVLTNLKDYRASQQHLRRAIEIWERVLPAGHPDIATAVDSLGTQYWFAGDFENAAVEYRRALAMREESLGPDHLEVGNSWMNLGLALKEQGKWREAEEHLLRSLEIKEKALDSDQPQVLSTLQNLAELYVARGRLEEALAIYDRIVEARGRTLGMEHPHVAGALKNQAQVLARLGRYSEAEAAFRRALTIVSAGVEPSHPFRAGLTLDLGTVLLRQGRPPEADSLYEEVREAFEEAGTTGEQPARAHLALARSALSMGQAGRARDQIEKSLQLRLGFQPEDHPAVLYTRAVSSVHKGDGGAALDLLRRSLEAGFSVDEDDLAIDFSSVRNEKEFRSLLAGHARR